MKIKSYKIVDYSTIVRQFLGKTVIIGIFLLTFLSCEDSNNQNSIANGNDEENVDVQVITKSGGYIGPWRTYIEDNGDGYAVCGSPALDCFPIDITIFPEHARTMNIIFNIIRLGNQGDIQDAFYAKQATLELYIDPDIVQGVIDGTVIVECNFNGVSGQKYMIFKDLSGNIIAVYPFV
ncbi:MAG: hypothetical protein PHW83_10030 [Bacteroidales bacterium]|nr:hypothetical protein [Bacteroidales bacterium]